MTPLDYLARLPWITPLGWTLIHFLWQGAAIGVLSWITLRMIESASPRSRHLVALGGMMLCALAPIGTFLFLAKPFSPRPVPILRNAGNVPVTPLPALADFPTKPVPSAAHPPIAKPKGPLTARAKVSPPRPAALGSSAPPAPPVPDPLDEWSVVPWCVALWFGGVLLATLRLLVGWCRIQLWRRQSLAR